MQLKNIVLLFILMILCSTISFGQKNKLGIYYNLSILKFPSKSNLLTFNTIGIDYYRKIAPHFSIGSGIQYERNSNEWSIEHREGANFLEFGFTDKFNTLNIDLLGKYSLLSEEVKYNYIGQIGISNQFYFTENIPNLLVHEFTITDQTIVKKTTLRTFLYMGIGISNRLSDNIFFEFDIFGKVLLNPKNDLIYKSDYIRTSSHGTGKSFSRKYTGNQIGCNVKFSYQF